MTDNEKRLVLGLNRVSEQMRKLLWLIILAAFMSCQEDCEVSECEGRSAIFSFRVLNSNQFDMVFELNQISQDSVFVVGSNEGAISSLPKELSIKFIDTIPVFQFNVDNVHLRYLVETRTADTVITDTIRTDYILENSECCGIELKSYSAYLNDVLICEDCQPELVHPITRD